jgi:hypothetical protein
LAYILKYLVYALADLLDTTTYLLYGTTRTFGDIASGCASTLCSGANTLGRAASSSTYPFCSPTRGSTNSLGCTTD